MELIYLAILFVSIAFAITVVYLSVLLHRITNMMKTLGNSLDHVEGKMTDLTPSLRKSLQETGVLVDDVQEKLTATDSVFDSIENMGKSVHNLNEAYQMNSDQVSDEQFKQKVKPFLKGIKWSEAAFQLFKKARN